jgi:hypothetical protein
MITEEHYRIIRLLLPAHEKEDYTDKYGVCHTVVEKGKSFINAQGELKLRGLTVFENEFKSKDNLVKKLLERKKTTDYKVDAFRDESVLTIFEKKINDQLDYNEIIRYKTTPVETFHGRQYPDTKVIWTQPKKEILSCWIPPTGNAEQMGS